MHADHRRGCFIFSRARRRFGRRGLCLCWHPRDAGPRAAGRGKRRERGCLGDGPIRGNTNGRAPVAVYHVHVGCGRGCHCRARCSARSCSSSKECSVGEATHSKCLSSPSHVERLCTSQPIGPVFASPAAGKACRLMCCTLLCSVNFGVFTPAAPTVLLTLGSCFRVTMCPHYVYRHAITLTALH